jgi:hypothetical protein
MNTITTTQPRARRPVTVSTARVWLGRFRDPLLTVLLAVQIFILFIMPCIRAAGLPLPQLAVYAVLLSFAMLATVISRSRPALLAMIVSVALSVTGSIWWHEQRDALTEVFDAAGQVLTQLCLLRVVSSAVFSEGRTTHHRILGAVVMYLGIGMIFISLDLLVAARFPGAFTHLPTDGFELREALTYFSFSTLTTASFGDITPVHPIARALANVESICGQLFPATLLARIVGLHSLMHRPAAPGPGL